MSSFYAPSITPDELYHYKYKDRYKGKNGKWVYLYDDAVKDKSTRRVNNMLAKDDASRSYITSQMVNKGDSSKVLSLKKQKDLLKQKQDEAKRSLTKTNKNKDTIGSSGASGKSGGSGGHREMRLAEITKSSTPISKISTSKSKSSKIMTKRKKDELLKELDEKRLALLMEKQKLKDRGR